MSQKQVETRRNDLTRYELPISGISLLGYIVRRMHKTRLITRVPALLAEKQTEEALASIAVYAVTASTSFGRAYYQPGFNTTGEEIAEPDPDTGVIVRARLETASPTYKISYAAVLSEGSSFTGSEEITGTKVSLRGLGMPAPSKFRFESGDYSAELTGVLTSELTLSLIGNTRIRGYGFLDFSDSVGNTGRLELDRSGDITLRLNSRPVIHHTFFRIVRLEEETILPREV